MCNFRIANPGKCSIIPLFVKVYNYVEITDCSMNSILGSTQMPVITDGPAVQRPERVWIQREKPALTDEIISTSICSFHTVDDFVIMLLS